MLTLFLILVVVALVFGIGAALKVAFWALLIAAILIALVVFGVRGVIGRRT